MELVRPRLGKNLDSPIAQLVIFGGEGILVDADFADRRLWRQLPRSKSIDINLSAIRPRRRTGERLQLRRQLVRIVREGIEVLAF